VFGRYEHQGQQGRKTNFGAPSNRCYTLKPLIETTTGETAVGIAMTFDTLHYAKALKAADVPERQAEAQAEALAEAIKRHNQALEVELERQRQTLEMGFKHEISEGQTRSDSVLVRVEAKVDRLETEFERLDGKVDTLETKLDRLEIKVDSEFRLVRKELELVDQRALARFKLLYWMLGGLIATLAPIAIKLYFGG